jgi:calcineurin-like phosphoesterase family protein
MNETLIKNWNRVVSPQDLVYFLGDFSFLGATKSRYILDSLNGKIYLIRGNHDRDILKDLCVSRFEWVKDYYYLKVQDSDGPDSKTQPVILCHYPILSWNKMGYGSWMLHGHTHANLLFDKTKRRYDVGVDNNYMQPVGYDKIKEIMSRVKFEPIDHHKEHTR